MPPSSVQDDKFIVVKEKKSVGLREHLKNLLNWDNQLKSNGKYQQTIFDPNYTYLAVKESIC